jgi:hypothetical protein
MMRVYGLGSPDLEYTSMAGICERGNVIVVPHNAEFSRPGEEKIEEQILVAIHV